MQFHRTSFAFVVVSVCGHVLLCLSLAVAPSSKPGKTLGNNLLPQFSIEARLLPPDVETVMVVSGAEAPKKSAFPGLRNDDSPKLLTSPPEIPVLDPVGERTRANDERLVSSIYLPTNRLTKRPEPLNEPVLSLPPRWLEATGQLVVTLYINDAGKVDDVVIGKNNVAAELHGAVADAFRKINFVPGEIQGKAVHTKMKIEADLSLTVQNRGVVK